MKPESLVQLVASGNIETVSEQWMRLFEEANAPVAHFFEYHSVLTELCRVGQTAQAEELAWSAIEMLSTHHPPQETLKAAGPFLRAVQESEELRAQVAGLYRLAYADRDGIDTLLEESGLSGGRPVRRALRTLDVCLALKEGDYLAARDDDGAARVESVDTSSWRFTVTDGAGVKALGATQLADRYRPAPATQFAVMRQFAPDRLVDRLWSNPVDMVVDICKRRENRIDSDRLEAILVPELLPEPDWKKWWTRARTALRKCPNIRITGRSPYELEYDETPFALDEEMLEAFERLHDPVAKHELLEKYLRECRVRREEASDTALRHCFRHFAERAKMLTLERAVQAGLYWVITRKVAELGGLESPNEAVDLFRTASDPYAVFGQIESPALLEVACTCLVEARPDDWQDQLLALLPILPAPTCDQVTDRLVSAGRSVADFEPVVERIMASPVDHFEALLWLWDGPSQADKIPAPPPVALLSRVLRALDECRRSEKVAHGRAKRLASRARAVLSARKYERFDRCVGGLDTGMGSALRTQLRRLDNLGRAVQVDLINHLDRRCPPLRSESRVEPWNLEDVLFVTEAGLARKQDEIEHHVNVTMKKNAEAIGRAAQRGDLSENSEYKFALEERDLLRARLAQMNAEVAAARVITPEEIPTDHAGIGTKVIFKRDPDGTPYEMTFVGPWEADHTRTWFNYQAPLARKILGRRVGDVVEFDHTGAVGKYEIVTLENGLKTDG